MPRLKHRIRTSDGDISTTRRSQKEFFGVFQRSFVQLERFCDPFCTKLINVFFFTNFLQGPQIFVGSNNFLAKLIIYMSPPRSLRPYRAFHVDFWQKKRIFQMKRQKAENFRTDLSHVQKSNAVVGENQKPDFPGQKPVFWSVWHLRIMIWRLEERRSLRMLLRLFFMLNSFLGIKTCENERLVVILQM